MVTCAVASCSNNTNRNKKPGVTFHSFPLNNPSILELWMQFLGSITDLGAWKPTMWSKVCSEHFTEDCFTLTKSVHRLRNDAVPTIALKTGAFGADNAAKALMELQQAVVLPTNTMEMAASTSSQTQENVSCFTDEAEEMQVDSSQEVIAVLLLPEETRQGESVVQKRSASDHDGYAAKKTSLVKNYRKTTAPVLTSFTFHTHVMLYFILSLLEQKINFKMACDYATAGKFDDIYIEVTDGDRIVHMFFDVRYSSRPIVLSDFIGDKRGKAGRFSIKDYLRTHVNMDRFGSSKMMFILYTNANIFYGNSMKELTLDDSILSEIYVNKPDIFAEKKLIQFKGHKFNKVLHDFTGVSIEYVDKFSKEFFLATDQPDGDKLESLIKGVLIKIPGIREEQVTSLFCCLKENLSKWQSEPIGEFLTNASVQDQINEFKSHSVGSELMKVEMIPKVFGVERHMDNFCERYAQLELLKRILEKEKDDKLIDVAITGMKGVGKTQLMRKFLSENLDTFTYVIWIKADSELSIEQTLRNYYSEITNNDASQLLQNLDYTQKIYNKLQTYKCLIIFDGAKSPQIINKFLPNISISTLSLYIIVTSTYTEWSCKEIINVEPFSREECVVLMKKMLQKNYAEDYVDMIAEKSGYLPLCINIACTYINDKIRANTLANVVQDKISLAALDIHTLYPYTYDMFFENLEIDSKHTIAKEILDMCALLSSEYIPVSLFSSETSDAVLMLQQHSIITVQQQHISLLRALQSKLLINMTVETKEVCLRKLLKLLQNKIHYDIKYLDVYLKHAIKVWEHVTLHQNLLREYPEFPVLILNNVQLDVITTTDYDSFVHNVCVSLHAVFGENNVYVCEIRSKKIEMFCIQGEYASALQLCNELLSSLVVKKNDTECLDNLIIELFKSEHMPSNHAFILSMLNQKAKIMHELENYNKAHQIYLFIYDIYKTHLKNHRKKVECLLDLHENCKKMKRIKSTQEMLELLQFVADALHSTVNIRHPACISVMCEQAACYEELGELSKSLGLFTKAEWLKSGNAAKQCTVELPIEVSLDTTSLQSKLYLADKIVEKKIKLFGKNDASVYKTVTMKTKILCELGQTDQVAVYIDSVNN